MSTALAFDCQVPLVLPCCMLKIQHMQYKILNRLNETQKKNHNLHEERDMYKLRNSKPDTVATRLMMHFGTFAFAGIAAKEWEPMKDLLQ